MKWELKTLDELGFVGRGKSRHRPRNAKHLYGGNYPFIQTGDIQKANFYINEYSQTYSENGLNQSKLWNEGTMVISIVGANTAETAILGFDACFPDSIIGFIPDNNISDVKFVKYNLEYLKLHLKSISEGTARENLSLEKLLSIKMSIPPIIIQYRIASILSAYDDLIENNMKRIKLLEEAALLNYKLIMKNEKNHEIPIRDICYITDGTHDSPSQQKEGFYLITGKHLINGFIDFSSAYFISISDHEKIQKRSKVENGDIILSNIGTLGNVAIIDSTFEFSVKNVIIFKPSFEAYSTFLYCYLQIDEMQNKFQLESSGTSQKFISLKYCRDLKVKIHSENVLSEFHFSVSKLLKLKSILNQQNNKLREARDILLPRLMNGELEV
jgi:type I restriction enzyme S subunit